MLSQFGNSCCKQITLQWPAVRPDERNGDATPTAVRIGLRGQPYVSILIGLSLVSSAVLAVCKFDRSRMCFRRRHSGPFAGTGKAQYGFCYSVGLILACHFHMKYFECLLRRDRSEIIVVGDADTPEAWWRDNVTNNRKGNVTLNGAVYPIRETHKR
jgi:hypothetical protein